MTPTHYIQIGTVAIFRYNTAELKEWIRLGNEGGNTGTILLRIDYAPGGITTRAGYGTIENPRTKRFRFHSKHHDIFGKQSTPEEILHPPSFEEQFPFAGWFIPGSTGPFTGDPKDLTVKYKKPFRNTLP